LPIYSPSPPDRDVFVENRLLHAALPLTELPLDGELDLRLSGGGLEASGSAVDSRDKPGSCLLPDIEPTSLGVSSWLFLYAAEPMPLSAVCRKNEGSFERSDCAIWILFMPESSGDVGSGVSRGDCEAVFSAPAMESGRRAAD
jgi:hypothetical protein